MPAMLEKAIDRMAATRVDTIWHRADSERDGILVPITMVKGDDSESKLLEAASWVLGPGHDNDCVGTLPIYTMTDDNGEPTDARKIETHVATISRTGRVLGIVTRGYHVISLAQVLQEWLMALVRAGGEFEVLGTFNGGRDYFATVGVADEWVVPGDHSTMRPHFNIVGNHTATRAILGAQNTYRTICGNTAGSHVYDHEHMTSAEERINCGWVRIRHTANASERMKEAVEWITDGRARAESEKQLLERLATKVISQKEIDKFIEGYIAIPSNASKNMKTVRERNRNEFVETMSDSDDLGNHALANGKISAYGLLQSVTRFEDWVAQINKKADQPVATRRAFRAFLNQREPEKATARDRIMELAGV